MIRQTFELPLLSKNRTHTPIGKGRKILTKEARAYFATVSLLAAKQGVRVMHGPFRLWVDVYFGPRGGDLSNVIDLLCDALNLRAWMDDKDACGVYLERRTADGAPRVVVTVEGERYATDAEVLAAVQKKAATETKRRNTRARNRKLEALLSTKPACD